MAKVWELHLPQPLKLLALAMADWADDHGEGIYPSIAYVAWKIGTTERTVQRQLRTLERIGILEVVAVRGHRSPNGQWTRLWTIHPERGDKLTPLDREGVTQNAERGDTGRVKGRHSYVTQSIRDPLDIQEEFSTNELDPPRLPGESHKDYMFRIADSWGS